MRTPGIVPTVLESPCPRCGGPSGDALCPRCVAYLLRFEPWIVRPGLPGPSLDREVRRGAATLPIARDAPVRFAAPRDRPEDEAFRLQFLNHVGLPDGGNAVLTRGDRAVLQGILRSWGRAAPKRKEARAALEKLYGEAASMAGMPPAAAATFRALAGEPTIPPEEPLETAPLPPTPPEPVREAAPAALPSTPFPDLPIPPPPPPEPLEEERRVLEALRTELAAKKEEFAKWISEQHEEMDRRVGTVRTEAEELRHRESAIAEKEKAVDEMERRLQERAEEVRRAADVARLADEKRALFFLLFSMEGIGRDAARAIADAFGTEDALRSATVEQIAAVPAVLPEQAAVVRDAFTGGAPARRDLREKAAEMLEEGEFGPAFEVYEEIIRQDPEDVDAWMNRGEVLALLGRPDDAVASYERVLALDPKHRGARAELANLLFEQGDYGGAATTLQELLRSAPDEVDHWLKRAAALLVEGKATESTLVYNAVLEGDPGNLTASLALGDLLLAMGDANAADREYTRALQHHPDDPEALLKKGLLLNRQGRWGAAIQLFNRAISLRWDFREAWAAKGQVLLSQAKPRDALECFSKLIALDDRSDDAWLGKAEAHLALGENDKAAEAAGRALALNKGNRNVQDLLERLRESADRPKEGLDVAEVPPPASFDAGVFIELADTLLEAGDAVAAVRAYNEVLARDPKDGRAWFGKGRALHMLERYGEAIRCFTTAVGIEPANDEYRRWLVVCEERWKKEGRA